MESADIYQILKNQFSDKVKTFSENPPFESYIEVGAEWIAEVCKFLKEKEGFEFDSLVNLSGVDDSNGLKTTDANGYLIIAGGTFSVYYHLESTKIRHKLLLKIAMPRENPVTESVTAVWAHANWHEREAYDMFGIVFNNHPNLIRILMPYDWEAGYPLRKDYKDPEFYKGMKVPY
jgi:NADH-quinone oxidoreductase subunit C